jgi:hypothetical protein
MLDKLSRLILEEKSLKRTIDFTYNRKKRTKILTRLVQVQKEIKETKIKLRIERELRKEEKKNGNIKY